MNDDDLAIMVVSVIFFPISLLFLGVMYLYLTRRWFSPDADTTS